MIFKHSHKLFSTYRTQAILKIRHTFDRRWPVVRHIPAIYKLPQHMNVVDAHDFLKSIENKYKFDSQKRISFMTTVPMKTGSSHVTIFYTWTHTCSNESKHYTTLDTVVKLKYLRENTILSIQKSICAFLQK